MVWLPHWPKISEKSSIKLGLERIKDYLQALGDPHKSMPPVIHVAGTNGKGSTVAFLKSILESAGLKVNVFTSPHIKRFNERIILEGEEISDKELKILMEECRLVSEKNNIDVSFFEGIAGAAFLAFSRSNADICLIETGMGGRLDATNVFEKPLMTIITPISFDHMDALGDTIAKIAYEKACIMKKDVPCVIAAQVDEAQAVFEKYSSDNQVPLFRYEYDFGIEPRENGFVYLSDDFKMNVPQVSLNGIHQFLNASTAIAAIRLLKGVGIDKKNIASGIANAKWSGRIQEIDSGRFLNKLPAESRIIIDGAHNTSGAQVLSTWLNLEPKMKTYLIVGFTKNRNPKDFLKFFKSLKPSIICVDVKSEPLSYSGRDISDQVEGEFDDVTHLEFLEDALNEIAKDNKEKCTVLITGSLFLVSDFLKIN